VGAELPPEPLSASCREPTYIAERTLGRDEVLVYAPVSGQWSVAPQGSLTPDTSWWSAGELHRGRTVVGQASIESLRLADVAYESSPHHDAPCRRSWVLVLDEGQAHHAQLSEVPEGAARCLRGPVAADGEGWVQPPGEVGVASGKQGANARTVPRPGGWLCRSIHSGVPHPRRLTTVLSATPRLPGEGRGAAAPRWGSEGVKPLVNL